LKLQNTLEFCQIEDRGKLEFEKIMRYLQTNKVCVGAEFLWRQVDVRDDLCHPVAVIFYSKVDLLQPPKYQELGVLTEKQAR
jgi:hypothetical protein